MRCQRSSRTAWIRGPAFHRQQALLQFRLTTIIIRYSDCPCQTEPLRGQKKLTCSRDSCTTSDLKVPNIFAATTDTSHRSPSRPSWYHDPEHTCSTVPSGPSTPRSTASVSSFEYQRTDRGSSHAESEWPLQVCRTLPAGPKDRVLVNRPHTSIIPSKITRHLSEPEVSAWPTYQFSTARSRLSSVVTQKQTWGERSASQVGPLDPPVLGHVVDQRHTSIDGITSSPARPSRDRRQSSVTSSPTALESERRRSSICPSSWKIATQTDHDEKDSNQNFSRPFSQAETSAKIMDTQIIQLLPPAAVKKRPLFRPTFSFNNNEKGRSDSMVAWSQHASEEDYDTLRMDATKRRRSSCVLLNQRKSIYTIQEEKEVRVSGKASLKYTKWFVILLFVLGNSTCIAVSWAFPKYWYICKHSQCLMTVPD